MQDLNLSEYLKFPFAQRHLLSLKDYSKDEILCLLAHAIDLKAKLKAGIKPPILANKALAMIFAKPSTRTRVSFEVGIHHLGGYSLFLSSNDIQLGRGEPVSDTAKVLSRYVDGIMIRTFKQEDVEELAQYSTIPVINGLTDLFHPCQALADVLTMYEHKKRLSRIKLAYIGDGNNVAHSLMIICTKLGIDISLACPERYLPKKDIATLCAQYSDESGTKLEITHMPSEAAKDADFIYTDVWISMGQEAEKIERLKIFTPYQVNAELFSYAKQDTAFLHCLPAHRGEEVTSGIIDSSQSLVFDQAENRLHAQKAVMALLMQNRG
jgi:ornithine carbamoyltransferase